MKHGEKMKRLLAVFLALAMAWTGVLPSSGLSFVQATEIPEDHVDASLSTSDSSDSTEPVTETVETVTEEENVAPVEETTETATEAEDKISPEPEKKENPTDAKSEDEKSEDEKSEDEKTEEEKSKDKDDSSKAKDEKECETHTFIYTPNNDGTHTVTCKDCDYEAIEDCVDEDGDGYCDKCKAKMPKKKEVVKATEEEVKSDEVKLIADFDFEDIESNDTITGAGAKATGSYKVVDSYGKSGKAIELDGKKQFLSVTKEDGSSLVAGLNEVSIVADVYFERTNTDWLYFIANNDNARNEDNLHYIGGFQNGSKLNVERFDSSRRGSLAPALSTNGWYNVEVVYSKDKTSAYINGDCVETVESDDSLKNILGDNPIFNIGKANWGSGEYCKAKIDNFKVYSGALSESQVSDLYNSYLEKKAGKLVETEFSLNAGYVTSDLKLPAEYKGNKITWTSGDEKIITKDGKVTRNSSNKEVTLTAKFNDGEKDVEKDFRLIVLKEGKDVVTYVSTKPATGQNGGMKIAAADGDGFKSLHKDQPIMYTAKGNKEYQAPTIMRTADGESFYMVAADGRGGQIITYTTKDLITYENENTVSTGDVSGVKKIQAVYDLTDEQYEIYLGTNEGTYFMSSKDMKEFTSPVRIDYDFEGAKNAPADAVFAAEIGLTNAEYDAVVAKFTNPYNTKMSALPTDEIKVDAMTSPEEFREILSKYIDKHTVKAEYSDGTKNTYSLRFTEDSISNVDLELPGTYTLEGVIGGSGNYTDATDPLIPERADPCVTYNEDDGYYYFTASYPMDGNKDPDGYDRIILRRAKTIAGLATAEEVSVWDESSSATLGRFIWAPEIHKIGDSWYIISTAGQNTSTTATTFNIRPFMIKFNGNPKKDNMLDASLWGDPVLVKPVSGDPVLGAMSLDMTYFEAGGNHYLIWADETKSTKNPSGLSYLFIATIDPKDPTQLTSKAELLTMPEYAWELVRYKVNEGPGVFHKDGKVYMTFSASGTGSEYCVGLMYADEKANLLDISNWTKLPYPILTSADFDDEVSGPGHNSFTYDEHGNLVIVYHARETKTHATHSGDPLYDPCRNAYVKTVFFDKDGLPIFNISSEGYAKDGEKFNVNVVVDGEKVKAEPILEYNFNEKLSKGVVVDASGNGNDGKVVKGQYVQDDKYGQVLYLDGDTSVGGQNSYLEFPKGFFDGRDKMTISFDVNEVTRSGNYFTFTLGTDSNKYLFYKAMPTAEKLAITANGSSEEKKIEASAKYPNTSRTWINITIVMDGTKMSLYRDGKLIGTQKNTKVKVSDLGKDLVGYLGKSFYPKDSYFRGYFDNVKVYDRAYKNADVEKLYLAGKTARLEAMGDLNYVANSYVIPNMTKIKGNISLPSDINGVSVTWKSSNESVISTKTVSNANYDATPAGVVTRQSADTNVTLTATFTKNGESVTKTYNCKVLAAPKTVDDYVGYLFVHFTGTENNATDEQLYFSVSKDGFNWEDLNNNNPIIQSTIGESGLRDMYIARTPEGDKFYMISTDLSIYHNKTNAWPTAGSNGSHSIVVWQSDDLVHWSKPWLAEIAPENAGCTWAPEFVYDEVTGEYVVYWSATRLEVDENENITQDYENHAIYYAKTRDFVHFTEPKLFHEGGRNSQGKIIKVIDSTMTKGNDGNYYRYTKNESNGSIKIDKADNVLGKYTDVKSKFLDKTLPGKVGAVEGPIIFKLNEKNEEGQDQWCLLIDRFARGQGYYPVITTDLASGDFEFVDDDKLGSYNKIKYRHGYVMPITADEYSALTGSDWSDFDDDAEEITLEKSKSGNPMLGFDENGDILYGGDPSILVDGDTVYAYVGHDTSSNESYKMPDWRCYSSKDMKNWKYEGEYLNDSDIKWVSDKYSAWAGQVVKHNDKYYFYYCSEAKKEYGGGKCIGVAVSDSPTGGFVDIGKPLVRNVDTYNGVSTWEDIDPTFWIETDEKGVEHRILGWGNVRFFNCELNDDMISIVDKDGDESKLSVEKASDKKDADIKVGVIKGMPSGHQFTEAPYYYKHKLANGKDRYYMFFAYDWREQMAYAYCDSLEDFLNNEWTFGDVVMEPSATANTNHMAVFDFKGHTYFVYHDGSLPHGSGFRRVACCEEFKVNPDGSIPYIKKTAVGLTGTVSKIYDSKKNPIYVKEFVNTLNDNDYPIVGKAVGCDFVYDGENAEWEINPGKLNKNADAYVSLESNYKPGLYLTVGDAKANGTYDVVLSQDVNGTTDEAKAMTFRTIKGLAGEGVTFESCKYHGFYLASVKGDLILTDSPDEESATFFTEKIEQEGIKASEVVTSAKAQKSVRMYVVGETIDTKDIRVRAKLENGKKVTIKDGIKLDVPADTTAKAGAKKLTVSYEYMGNTYETELTIQVVDKSYRK